MLLAIIGWPIGALEVARRCTSAALAALGHRRRVHRARGRARRAGAIRRARAEQRLPRRSTSPFRTRKSALKLCAPDELATRVGAVNTLVFEGDKPAGYNTDVHGFLEMASEVGAPLDGTVVMLGAGGGARAVAARASMATASWRSSRARRATFASTAWP